MYKVIIDTSAWIESFRPQCDKTFSYLVKDLIIKDKIPSEGKSLKTIITEMEDEVLANAGVDVFEEVFKLIFTKLYDEHKSQQDRVVVNYFLKDKNYPMVAEPKAKYGKAKENSFDEVKEVIVDILGVDESKVTMDARFREDLEADSLDLVELIMAFEDKFGGEISDEDAQKITTVGEAVKYIEERMKA